MLQNPHTAVAVGSQGKLLENTEKAPVVTDYSQRV